MCDKYPAPHDHKGSLVRKGAMTYETYSIVPRGTLGKVCVKCGRVTHRMVCLDCRP